MPIINQEQFDKWVENNKDPYGKMCMVTAIEAMNILDELPEGQSFNADDIVSQADRNLDIGITGFMAGCIASIVSQCHSRGDEFRRSWNKEIQIENEGEKATEAGTVLNPALLCIERK